ncbi:MAG: hypothetical protein AAFY82_05245 [Pseudomonadota bacterium]
MDGSFRIEFGRAVRETMSFLIFAFALARVAAAPQWIEHQGKRRDHILFHLADPDAAKACIVVIAMVFPPST